MRRLGVTLIELILVLVIVAVGAALVVPGMQRGIEHREAKKALQTLETIAHAIKMYEVNNNVRLGPVENQITLRVLEDNGHLDVNEYFQPSKNNQYEYGISYEGGNVTVMANKTDSGGTRWVQITRSTNSNVFDQMTDSEGFLNTD